MADLSRLQHLSELLGEDGVLLTYSSPSQPNMDLQLAALKCLTNICVRWALASFTQYRTSAVHPVAL